MVSRFTDNTEIGIEDIYLVAMVGSRAQSFEVGELSGESIALDVATFIRRRQEMTAQLSEIHEESAGMETEEGAIVVTYDGYLCGVPNLFTNDVNEAFPFKVRGQAGNFIRQFADALLNPQVLDYP